MKDNLFLGAKAKYRIEIESPGFNMETDDFELELKCGIISQTFRKSDLIDKVEVVSGKEKHQFYLCFDTLTFGAGDVVVIVKAYVPDEDFPGGIRLEKDRFRLINIQES